MEIVFDGLAVESAAPRLLLIATRNLPKLTELTWRDVHLCSAACDAHMEEPHVAEHLEDLIVFTAAIRATRQEGGIPNAPGAHAIVVV